MSQQSGDFHVPYANSSEHQRPIFGTLIIFTFIVIWVGSIAVPALVVLAITKGWYMTAASLTSLVILAYYPFPTSPRLRDLFGTAFRDYFRETSLLFEVCGAIMLLCCDEVLSTN